MALTQIDTGGIKDDAVTDAKLPANSVGNSEMKDDAVGVAELSATGTASSSSFLRGDNSWQAISTTTEGTAVLSTGETGTAKFLRVDGDDSSSWQVPPDTTYSVGDGGLTQNNFTNTLKTKLDGIATSANNYTHPNHTGEVTSTADGAQVIASNVVDEDNLKVSNSPTNGYFLSAQSGNTGGLTWAAAAAGGITEADQWCMNADWTKSGSGWTDVDSNWSRPTGTGTANGTNLGTGMTESSGVFTFPSTGFWLVRLHATGYNSSDTQYWQISIGTVGGTYHSEATTSIADQGSSDWFESQSTEAIFDVTDVTSNDFKIKFRMYSNTSMNLDGADQMRTGFTFIKLADT